jgi:hypothetical protein
VLHSTSYEFAGYFQDLLLHCFLQGLHQLIKGFAEFVNTFIRKLLRHFVDADAQFQ